MDHTVSLKAEVWSWWCWPSPVTTGKKVHPSFTLFPDFQSTLSILRNSQDFHREQRLNPITDNYLLAVTRKTCHHQDLGTEITLQWCGKLVSPFFFFFPSSLSTPCFILFCSIFNAWEWNLGLCICLEIILFLSHIPSPSLGDSR